MFESLTFSRQIGEKIIKGHAYDNTPLRMSDDDDFFDFGIE